MITLLGMKVEHLWKRDCAQTLNMKTLDICNTNNLVVAMKRRRAILEYKVNFEHINGYHHENYRGIITPPSNDTRVTLSGEDWH